MEPFVMEDLYHPALNTSIIFSSAQKPSACFSQLRDGNYLLHLDWQMIDESKNVNDSCSLLYEYINQLLDIHVPVESRSIHPGLTTK